MINKEHPKFVDICEDHYGDITKELIKITFEKNRGNDGDVEEYENSNLLVLRKIDPRMAEHKKIF